MEMIGLPTVWWLWWFVVPTALYVILILWFRSHGRDSGTESGAPGQQPPHQADG